MRIATWNLNRRWSSEHAAFLRDQAADIWCLTEVTPVAIDDGSVAGYPAVASTGRMKRGQIYAVIAARVAPTVAKHPHPATVVADVGGIAFASSVLPWSGAGGQPGGVWAGDRIDDWLADALAAIRVSGATVWGGDWNRNLAGCWQSVGTARSDAAIREAVAAMGLVAATAALPHQKPGLFAIDHIAVPVSWRVVTARRIVADRLSDHDAYVVDAEPGL
jgi:endonuclease/exonuclease/phosphatase family metal-dependent hydrolase